jgi:hypothetical protein
MTVALIKNGTSIIQVADGETLPGGIYDGGGLSFSGGVPVGWSANSVGGIYAVVSATLDAAQDGKQATGYDLGGSTINAGPPVTASVKRIWEAVTPSPAIFTPLQFVYLFTQPEQLAIAASTDPQVKLFLTMGAAAKEIDLSSELTINGVNYLASQGLITSERAAAILASSAPAQ